MQVLYLRSSKQASRTSIHTCAHMPVASCQCVELRSQAAQSFRPCWLTMKLYCSWNSPFKEPCAKVHSAVGWRWFQWAVGFCKVNILPSDPLVRSQLRSVSSDSWSGFMLRQKRAAFPRRRFAASKDSPNKSKQFRNMCRTIPRNFNQNEQTTVTRCKLSLSCYLNPAIGPSKQIQPASTPAIKPAWIFKFVHL